MIKSKDIRSRVTIRRKGTATQSSSGAVTRPYEDFATVWAKVQAITGRELEIARSFKETVTHKIVVRHNTDVLPTDILTWRTKTMYINAVTDDPMNVETVLYCTEGPSAN